MLTRRAMVGKFVAGVALAYAGKSAERAEGSQGSTGAGVAPIPSGALAQTEVEVAAASGSNLPANAWRLLNPLTQGAEVSHGWTVADLTDVSDGSCVLTLRSESGRSYRIHLCRNDGRPQGLVYTDQVDLVVMNGGQGDLPTDEGLAQAVANVAHVLAANETRQDPVVVALLPHAERLRRFGDGEYARLR